MKLRIGRDKKKGRAVFANEEIEKNEIIETCELLFIHLTDLPPDLEGYVYQYNKSLVAIALGNGSLYNHDSAHNASFAFNRKKKILVIRARRSIKIGEEITINYGYDKEQRQRFRIS